MRRFTRPDLSQKTVAALARKQARADIKHAAGTLDVDTTWNAARKTIPLQTVLTALKDMTGQRERCMYCGDSHGTDIEHFWPKGIGFFPERMFLWSNLLLCCTDCGRIKGIDFPLQNGVPMLVDPTAEDPWVILDFDPATGNIVSRFDPAVNDWDAKGEATVEVLELDRREALASGYLKTYRRLQDVVSSVLEGPAPGAADLICRLIEDDDHGLLGWCFRGAGQNESPFRELRVSHPGVWIQCANAFINR